MSGMRYQEIAQKPFEILDLTSLTKEEFEALVPGFEVQFQARMREWRLDGKPRTKRSYSTYLNCPLPSPADRLLFILAFVKNNPVQTFHGRAFGMAQSKANQWIRVLLPVLGAALRCQGDTPARSVQALTRRLGGDGAAGAGVEAAPLFVMTEPNDGLGGPAIRLNKKAVIAARKNVTP